MQTARYQTFNRPYVFAILLLCLLTSAWIALVQAISSGREPAPTRLPDLSQLPLQFVPNAGQSDPQARFVAHSVGGSMRFSASGVAMLLSAPADGAASTQVLAHMSFVGTGGAVSITGDGTLPGKANYITGSDRSNWHTNLPTYSAITYSGLYRGISLAYSANQSRLKGTYIVAPGADPGQIRWRYDEASRVQVDGQGNLQVTMTGDSSGQAVTIVEERPVAWQEIKGVCTAVSARYVVAADQTIGFSLGSYDATYPLTLDPTVTYGSYLGGSTGASQGNGIAVDASGNFYIMGITGASNFPVTPNAYRSTYSGANDAFVAKFNPNGSLAYATYLGGSGQEGEMIGGGSIAVDSAGDAIVVGETASSNYPTTANAFQPNSGGGNDGFVSKLDPTGSNLLYSSYLGGSCSDYGYGAAVDAANNFYAAGTTCSMNFPTINPYQSSLRGGYNGFVVKFAQNNSVVYSTFFGGSANDTINAVAADSHGNAYLAGRTDSPNFPVINPIQRTLGGQTDAFLSKLNPTGQVLVYSTYLGGSQSDVALGVAVDAVGQAYVAGSTYSPDFPTHNPLQGLNGSEDAFVTKVSADGSSLVYSTFFGGSNGEDARGIAVDPVQNAYITGVTTSGDLPLVNPVVGHHGNSSSDGYIAKLNPNGSALTYSSYLGAYNAGGQAVAADSTGNLYVTGQARTDLPITGNAVQPTPQWGNGDAFALVVSEAIPAPTGTPVCTIRFSDVPSGSTFYPYVECLACKGILGGYPDGTFRPNANVTRGQLSKFIANAASFSEAPGTQAFQDVTPSSTFYDYVQRLANRGYISGYACGGAGEPCGPGNLPYFRPNHNATRAQFSKIAANAAGLVGSPGSQLFQDVPPSSPFYTYVNRLANLGVIGGYACGGPGEPCVPPANLPYFRPNNNTTRGQTSKIVSLTFFPECSQGRAWK
jgi:hypothetical protein